MTSLKVKEIIFTSFRSQIYTFFPTKIKRNIRREIIYSNAWLLISIVEFEAYNILEVLAELLLRLWYISMGSKWFLKFGLGLDSVLFLSEKYEFPAFFSGVRLRSLLLVD